MVRSAEGADWRGSGADLARILVAGLACRDSTGAVRRYRSRAQSLRRGLLAGAGELIGQHDVRSAIDAGSATLHRRIASLTASPGLLGVAARDRGAGHIAALATAGAAVLAVALFPSPIPFSLRSRWCCGPAVPVMSVGGGRRRAAAARRRAAAGAVPASHHPGAGSARWRQALRGRWRGSLSLLAAVMRISMHMNALQERMRGTRYDAYGPWPVAPPQVVAAYPRP